MAIEPLRTYRLVRNGEAGLTCDADGVTLGGVWLACVRAGADGVLRSRLQSADEVGEILRLAYGAQRADIVDRCHRGLRRVAAHLEAGDLALAGIEALMLRLPPIASEGMAKLARAAELAKGGDAWESQPRLPAGEPGGGEWTTDSGSSSQPPGSHSGGSARGEREKAPRSSSQEGHAADDAASEITVTSSVVQSRHQNPNGFFPNSAGGGVFYIPTASRGLQIKSTEVHAEDANAFQVSWNDDTISLTDAKGTVVQTGTTPDALESFNATTGRALGVAIYAFPDTPLVSPDAPPTAEEQQRLGEESAAFEAGRQASEQSWSGRITTAMVVGTAALPFLALLPAAAEAPVEGPLNTAEELWPRAAENIPSSGAKATAQGNAYEIGIRSMYPETTNEALRFGESSQYKADAVSEIFGRQTAIDAKYADNWTNSIRNPDSAIGGKPFAIEENRW